MARILLTSSQVSVIISATIVVFFTLALFLSGYTLQQRTLRDLRAAIKPREARTSPQAHLPDYFKVKVEELDDGTVSVTESDALRELREQKEKMVVEVKESFPEPETQQDNDSNDSNDNAPAQKNGATKRQMALLEALNKKAAVQQWAVENPDPLSKSRIPVTRAQRRKMIKEEIQRLAQSEKPVYYQRRLW